MFEWTGVYFNQVVYAPVEYSRMGLHRFYEHHGGGKAHRGLFHHEVRRET